ncbi:Hypothetical protein CINCED_3A019037 [Cinara cedri]|uniref:Uncharacterized protein n=1 Tax=Cinara cedri TaxID=506608 RepID=A0A5E4N9X6_9HEMI|nr:Hypothetical protein CINCED_3A019037 [Cinara cedri]
MATPNTDEEDFEDRINRLLIIMTFAEAHKIEKEYEKLMAIRRMIEKPVSRIPFFEFMIKKKYANSEHFIEQKIAFWDLSNRQYDLKQAIKALNGAHI